METKVIITKPHNVFLNHAAISSFLNFLPRELLGGSKLSALILAAFIPYSKFLVPASGSSGYGSRPNTRGFKCKPIITANVFLPPLGERTLY